VTRVVVTGAGGLLGRRVMMLLLDDASVTEIVALDREPVPAHDRVRSVRGDVAKVDLRAAVEGATCVVHLAFIPAEQASERAARANVEGTRRLLEAMADAAVPALVVLSSATVYGARPTNPVPLTEDAPVVPEPTFSYAVLKAEIERLARTWSDDSPARRLVILRPTTALAEDGTSWLARALADAARLPAGDDDPPAQFLHLDDLAYAVDLVRREPVEGVFNVAPDGWVPGDEVRRLAGAPPRPRLPERVAAPLAEWSWALRRGPIPPGLLPYTLHPWVVANDRLKAIGWVPTTSNEEAFVAGTESPWWTSLSPKRKQELALGAAGATAAAAVAGVAAVLVRFSRRRG
jgi:nucleoside-diphosphate-sugar epimerase